MSRLAWDALRPGAHRNSQLEVAVIENPDDASWMLDARCRGVDPAEFFPSDGVGVDVARRMCAGCPVRAECLEYALLHRIPQGVWGGASERERRRILRARRLSAGADASLTEAMTAS